MKILLVEDEALVAELLADAFDKEGHQTIVTHSGEEALRFLREERADVMFLDLVLPKMSGIAVLNRIRSMGLTLPVIIITGHPDADDIEEAQRLGVTEVIEKPFVLKSYSEALGRVTGQNR